MGWGRGELRAGRGWENLMWFRWADNKSASISTEQSAYKAGNSLRFHFKNRSVISRDFREEGCDPRFLCSAKLLLMCEAIKKETLSEMQRFRKSASFLCCRETVLKCFLVDWEINQIKDSKADDIVNCREKISVCSEGYKWHKLYFLTRYNWEGFRKPAANVIQNSCKWSLKERWNRKVITKYFKNEEFGTNEIIWKFNSNHSICKGEALEGDSCQK